MATDPHPRTPVRAKCEGMEGIALRWERMAASRGFGGSCLQSVAYGSSGEHGEDGEDICNPPRAYVPLRGVGSVDALSCVGSDLSSPSPPSSPFATQPIVFIRLHPLHPLQSIPSLFQSIPSIPSL
jgi:hypothetical protein